MTRHIAIIIASLGAGGAERVIAQLTHHWAAQGHRLTILAFDDENAPIYHAFAPGVRMVRMNITRRHQSGAGFFAKILHKITGPLTSLRRIIALARAIRRERPDILVSFLTKINILSLIAKTGTYIPTIISERNNPERQDANPIWTMASALLYPKATAIICQTKASIRTIPARSRVKCRVIPNPVCAPDIFSNTTGQTQKPRHIVAVGRLCRQKGFDLLITAFAKIADDHPDWHLKIWGEGPDHAILQNQITAQNMQARISLCGLSTKPGAWVIGADAFILPSRYEGFPNVLGEAMAAALPVIATTCDFGPTELIMDEINGLLVPPENVDALAMAMDRLFKDADLREKLSKAAPNITKIFSPDHILALWDDAIDISQLNHHPLR